MNIVISSTNLATAVTTDSEVSTLPAANLLDTSRQVVWRSSVTTCKLMVDLGSSMSIQLVALAGLNLPTTGTIRLRLSTVSMGAGDVLDTGAGAPDINVLYKTWAYVAAAAVNARYVQIDFTTSGSYVEAGRLWIGAAFIPAINYEYNPENTTADMSQIRRGVRSGRTFTDAGPKVRSFGFTLSGLTAAEAATIEDMYLTVGTSGQVVVIPNPSGSYVARETFIGRLEVVRAVSQTRVDRFSTALRVIEDM